jgi:hypothetical protein
MRPLTAGVVALWLALPGAAAAQAPREDRVVGSGNLPAPSVIAFTVDVRSGPSGQSPAGTFTYDILDSHFQGSFLDARVTCLDVRGRRAVLGVAGTIRLSGSVFFPEPPRAPFPAASYVFFADNGAYPGGGVEAVVDAMAPPDLTGPVSPTPLTGCAGATVPEPLAPNVIGEVTVLDAPAVPQSKDDCMHGGFDRFGFANQGRCVASVTRSGPAPRGSGG